MILYTPMQLELVLEGLENMSSPADREVVIEGVSMLVEDTGPRQVRVKKLLTTDPGHYLNPAYAPGSLINI